MAASRLVSIVVTAILVLFSLTNLIYPDSVNFLGLVPANLLITHNYIWILITSCFLEVNPIRLVVDLFLLFIISYEVKWTPVDQFGLYFGLNIVLCTVGTLLEMMYRFYISNSEAYLVEATYGCGGVIMGIIMFIRQQLKNKPVIPQYPVITFDILPTVLLAFFTVLFLLGEKVLTKDISFWWISYFFSWTYLRFFYKYETDVTGDQSEEFKFISMYPEVLHPVVLPMSIAFYNLFAMCGLFPKVEADKKVSNHHLRYHDTNEQSSMHFSPSPSSSSGNAAADAVAERRKAKAQKLLDAKLAELSQEHDEGWGDKEEGV